MQNDSRSSSAFKLETAGNRSFFLSLANQGCTTVVALWKETSARSSENYGTKVLHGSLQCAQVLQRGPLPFWAGRCFEKTPRSWCADRVAGGHWHKRSPPGLQTSFSGTLLAWGVETVSKQGLLLYGIVIKMFNLLFRVKLDLCTFMHRSIYV